jgi:hypothetical protein
MKGSVKLPVFIDDARKYVNTTQLRAKYLGASYEAEYCQWQALHGLGSLMETASLIITPNAYLEGKLIASYPPDPIGDFDVTRATTATRVNSAGLVELVPYNLLQYSSSFSNAYWTKYQSSVTGGQSGYDGSTNAFLLTDTAANDVHILQPNFTTSGQHTISIYAKANSLNWVWLRGVQSSANVRAWFNLSTGTIGTVETNGTANIESVGNGWYRCSLTIANHQSGFEFYYGVANANNTTNYVGSGQSIFVQDAQLVEGSTAKDYQKTETRLNIPRLDYSNGTCPSLLVEPQRTNRIVYSSSFDNGAWSAIDTTISANTTISPDGIQNADTMAISSSTSRIFQYTGLGAGTYTASVYVKALSGTPTIQFRMVVDGTDITQSIPTTTEWVRHDFTFTASTSMDYFVLRGESGTGSVAIWGAQLEAGSYSTSYIPTTSASVTRNADVISKTGISSLIGQTEGTLFVDFNYFGNINAPATFEAIPLNVGNGTFSNSIYFTVFQSTLYLVVWSGGVNQATITLGAVTQGRYKAAVTYINNDVKAYLNGTLAGSDTSVTLPTLSGVYLGAAGTSTTPEAHSTNAAALWKTRLTNTQLAELTSL